MSHPAERKDPSIFDKDYVNQLSFGTSMCRRESLFLLHLSSIYYEADGRKVVAAKDEDRQMEQGLELSKDGGIYIS